MSSRGEAANLLRAIRAVGLQRAGDLLDWAMTIMPDSVSVQRLHIRALLHSGDVIGAESAAARALLQRPRNVSLCLLRAECLAGRGRWHQANEEVLTVLTSRPHHRRTRELAARIAIACGEPHRAVTLLDEAMHLPDDRTRSLLVDALIGAGNVERARWTLDAMQAPPALQSAAVLRAQGRLLDAVDVLEDAIDQLFDVDDEAMCQLLSMLEQVGDMARMQRAVRRVTPAHPRSRLLIGRMLLSQGRFRAAALNAASMLHSKLHQAETLPTLVVAAAMLGRSRLSKRALARLRHTREGINARVMADRWKRGMLGQWLRAQYDARQAGCDPGSSVLQALLDDARASAQAGLKKSRRIRDSAGGAQMSERKNVLVSSPVDC